MPNLIRPLFQFSILGLAVAIAGGCSAESKKARHLAKADQYYSSSDYEKAEIEYKNARQIEPLNPHSIIRLAIIYFDQGRTSTALAYLKKANELDPKHLEVRLRLAKILIAAGGFDEARKLTTSMLENTPLHDEVPSILVELASTPAHVVETRARFRQLPIQSAAVLAGLGFLDLREHKFKEAEAMLIRARELDPKSSLANAILGLLYQSQNELQKAEQAFQTASDASPVRSPRRIQLIQFLRQAGKLEAAKRVLDETLKSAPDFIPARVLMADIAATEKRFDESLALLDRVFASEPTYADALLLAAKVHLAKGDADKAVVVLESTVKNYPKAALAHYQLGLAYLAKSETGKATGSFADAANIAPEIPAPVIALAELNLRQGNSGPAIAALRKLLQKSEIPEARLLLANAYRTQGNLEDALASYRQLSATLPRNSQAHLFSGIIFLQQNKFPEARTALTKAFELAPNDLVPFELLVNVDLTEKQYAVARKRVEEQITKSPTAARLQILLSKVQLAQSDIAGAESSLRKAIELEPESSDAYMTLAQLYVSRNEHVKALADLQTSTTKNPKDPRPFLVIASLHEQQRNFPAARESYEKALAISPQNIVALNNLASLYTDFVVDLDKALEYSQRAKDLLPKLLPKQPELLSLQPAIFDTLGWVLYKKRLYSRALALLEESSEKLAQNPDAQFHLGMTLYKSGEEERAKSTLEAALKLSESFHGATDAKNALFVLSFDANKATTSDRTKLEKMAGDRGDDSVALNRLGMLDERDGNADKALSSYEAAIKASPSNITAALNIVRMHRARNNAVAALDAAKAIRKLAPTDARVAKVLGSLAYENADFQWSLSLMQDAARREPDDPAVLYSLSQAMYSVGRITDAQTSMRRALEISPNFTQAGSAQKFLEMVAFGVEGSQASAAAQKIELSLKADPSDVPALMAKAKIAESKGDTESARQCYEKALTKFPDFSPAKKSLVIIYARKQIDDKRGLELATKAREAFPDDAELARAFGIISFRLGNFARASSLLQESARTRTNDALVFYYLGMSQIEQKNQASGTRSLQHALELGLPADLTAEANRVLARSK